MTVTRGDEKSISGERNIASVKTSISAVFFILYVAVIAACGPETVMSSTSDSTDMLSFFSKVTAEPISASAGAAMFALTA